MKLRLVYSRHNHSFWVIGTNAPIESEPTLICLGDLTPKEASAKFDAIVLSLQEEVDLSSVNGLIDECFREEVDLFTDPSLGLSLDLSPVNRLIDDCVREDV